MTTKPATLATIARRFERACRAAGAPTKRERAAEQRQQDAEIARKGEEAAAAARRSNQV